MARTFVRQATQIRKSDAYVDTIEANQTNFETSAVSVEDDLNSIRSQLNNLLNVSGSTGAHWYNDLTAPVTFELGAKRGVKDLNSDLHDLERKRVLTNFVSLADVFVSSSNNYAVLAYGELPNPGSSYAVAVGTSTVTGSVASSVTIGSHSLNEVAGATPISPKNLCTVVTGSSRDFLFSSGRQVYALFQTDVSDGGLLVGGDAQLSFVRIDATGNDLEAVPAADVEGKTINYVSVARKALKDLSEQDFLRGAEVEVPSAASTATRQNGYDNQGATPVELSNNASLDIGGGFFWELRDALNATVLRVTEGSTGGTTTVLVDGDTDTFQSDAVVNKFTNGLSANTNVEVGISAGQVNTKASSGVNLRFLSDAKLLLDDSYRTGWTTETTGIPLSNNSTEWTDFKTNFGEVSLLSAINTSYGSDRRSKTYANVTGDVAADTDVSLANSNLDAALPDMSKGSFLSDYDVYLNGELLRPGANSGDNNDYYPGSVLTTAAKLKFEFPLKTGDVLCVVASNTLV